MKKNIVRLIVLCFLIGCDQKEVDPDFASSGIESNEVLQDVILKSYHAQSGLRIALISELIGHREVTAVSVPTPIIWVFWPIYFDVYGSLKAGNLLCSEYPNSRECAIATLLQSQGWIDLCLSYGDVPYSQALKGAEFVKPIYDSQESIIKDNLLKLEEIAKEFEAQSFDSYNGGDDIFGGNQQDWAATANGLLARYYLILSNQDSEALSKASIHLAKALSLFQQESVITHLIPPLKAFDIDRAGYLPINFSFNKLMNDRNDPRADLIIDGELHDYQETFWFQDDAPFSIISLEEMYFMRAEIALINGQVSQAQQDLNQAVVASFEKMESTDYADYFTSHVQINPSDPLSAQLDSVFTEKLYALAHFAPDILWNDFRRTGFPSVIEILSPTITPSNASNPYPHRIPYPQSEFELNQKNVEAAVLRQGEGTGEIRDKLWVFE